MNKHMNEMYNLEILKIGIFCYIPEDFICLNILVMSRMNFL